jgi:orotidine-5'-phosphate decarboxylase
VTPGIRPSYSLVESDDQARVMTPKEAVQAGVDHMVIGRPIVKDASPKEAAEKIIQEIEDGLRANT